MARFYFHLLGNIRWEDGEGQDFPNLSSACQSAIERIGAAETRAGRAEAGLSIQVTSDDGTTLFAASPGQPSPLRPRTIQSRLH